MRYSGSPLVRSPAWPLRQLTCQLTHAVLPATRQIEVAFPPLLLPKLVLDLATLNGCKVGLTWALRKAQPVPKPVL